MGTLFSILLGEHIVISVLMCLHDVILQAKVFVFIPNHSRVFIPVKYKKHLKTNCSYRADKSGEWKLVERKQGFRVT